MNVSLGELEAVVHEMVKSGRYVSASEVMREGVRLVQEREAKLVALRETLNASIERGGAHSPDNVRQNLNSVASELAAQGY